ncbi:MAG: hypothetical protein HY898_36685 [Deltaproteobacteria bacterium]|nr:hypothetical protein [Deltaproteobacteria bacterium]
MSVVRKDPRSQAAQLLDDVIARVASLKSEGRFVQARRLVRDSATDILGPIGYTIEQVDAQSAASLLGSEDRITIAAVLLGALAELDELGGDANGARACRRRALELYLEVVLLGSDPNPEILEAISRLRPQLDEWRLAERYQAALAKL